MEKGLSQSPRAKENHLRLRVLSNSLKLKDRFFNIRKAANLNNSEARTSNCLAFLSEKKRYDT